jgi:hypothetical protein
MIEVNPTRFKLPPWEHQLRGVKTLLKKDVYGLFWKMRLGKTKVIIDTACLLFEAGIIDTLLIVAPAQVKDVWCEPNLGEIKTHDWSGSRVYKYEKLDGLIIPHNRAAYVAASIEFLRQQGPRGNFPFVDNLLSCLSGRRIWFVFDEASVLGNHKSLNTKAMIALRNGASAEKLHSYGDDPLPVIKKVTILDGTPRGNSHLSFYSKFKVLDPTILGCKVFEHYRARYSELVKVPHKWATDPVTKERKAVASHMEVVKEKNMEDFTRRTAPYCEYLEQDPKDMPAKVPGVLTVALSDKAWKAYCSMRDELVAEIDQGICAVGQAAVKSIRLAQLCAGFLGGVTEFMQMDIEDGRLSGPICTEVQTVEVHDAPTKMLMKWLEIRFDERPDFKCVVWSRFVPEIERLIHHLVKLEPEVRISSMYGARKTNHELFHPKHEYNGPMVMIAQAQSAQYGYNFSKADTVVYLSQDYNRITRAQSEDRVQAIGSARQSTSLLDVIVTGPRGQKTIVHDIIQSVREKEDAEKRTAKDWVKALTEE